MKYMSISMSKKRRVLLAREEDWLNDTQAPLATALGDPNQTDHCSYKKKKVNRVENVEVW